MMTGSPLGRRIGHPSASAGAFRRSMDAVSRLLPARTSCFVLHPVGGLRRERV